MNRKKSYVMVFPKNLAKVACSIMMNGAALEQ